MVYKFFDKISVANQTETGINSENRQFAEGLHHQFYKKIEKCNVYLSFEGNIWSADLADMQLISKFNKGIRLCIMCY